jgi:hypothetical protein
MFQIRMFRHLGALAMLVALSACGGSGQASLVQNQPTGVTPTPDAGTVQFDKDTYTVDQDAGTVTVSVTRTGSSVGAASINYSTTDGTALDGVDYSAMSGTLNWADGDSTAQTITIPIDATAAYTGQKSFTIGLDSPSSGLTLGTPSSATITIQGSGVVTPPTSAGTLSLSASLYTVAQSAGMVTISVTRTGGSDGAVSVHYATADGTAGAGADYTAKSGTLSWADGDSTSQSFTIPISTALGFDGQKTFIIGLDTPTGGASLGAASATIAITGSGAPPATTAGSLSLSASSYSVKQSAGTLTISVTRTGGSDGAVTVNYATSNGTAKSGTDYTAINGTLSWADGDSASKTFAVAISNATAFSGSRTFTIKLSSVTGGAALGSPVSATATITGGGTAGSLALSASSYSVSQAAGTLTVSVARASGSAGAVTVAYATANGTATAGTDYTAKSGTLSWASGDAAAKTFAVAISNATAFSGSRTFTVKLSGPTGGATLGTPNTATATITGSNASGTLKLSASAYSVSQASATTTVSVSRTGGSSGAVTVAYATANGTASSGTDYTAKSGTLSWAAADTSAKTFNVAISNATPFTGTRAFTIKLSAATGGAALGTPNTATVTITGSGTAGTGGCAKNSSSYTTSGAFDSMQYGVYFVNNNNWGGTPNQQFWSNSADCWGVTTSSTQDTQSIGSYPSATRGWSQNATAMQDASPANPRAWTVQSGMGIPVTSLTKAKIHWAFQAPTNTGVRWLGLQDIYFHKTNNPDPSEFPPFTDLMIDQSIADQVLDGTTFYAASAVADNATTVTIGGNTYMLFIDDSDETGYHQTGGHNIHLFNLPTAFNSNNALAIWGSFDAVNDVAAIVRYFMQANPVDDAGHALKNSNGQTITSPLIASNLFLTAINSGWEIDTGTVFTNTAFCVALQSEPDCP